MNGDSLLQDLGTEPVQQAGVHQHLSSRIPEGAHAFFSSSSACSGMGMSHSVLEWIIDSAGHALDY